MMKSNYLITNQRGEMKTVNADAWPEIAWTTIGDSANTSDDDLYARVSPVFRAVNLFASVAAGIPFALVDKAGKDYDISTAWKNKIGFIKNPNDLFRRWFASMIMTNSAYGFMESNQYRATNLMYILPATIKPIVKQGTAAANYTDSGLMGFTRTVGAQRKDYSIDEKRIVYIWWLDHTTEMLPSKNTRFRAMASAAGILRFADIYIENYFASGGVKPAIIGLKGLVQNDSKEKAENTWDKFIRGVSRLRAKVVNADVITVTPFGDGIKDMQGNDIFVEQCKKISMATGMPIAMLLSDNANYSTAETYTTSWFRDDVFPFVQWFGGEATEKIFEPYGLTLEYRPEMTDEGTEDEVQRSSAFTTFGDAFTKYPTAETFLQAANTFGFELSEEMIAAVNSYYNKPAEKPAPVAAPAPVVEPAPEPTPEPAPAKFHPTLEQYREMDLWQTFAFKALKKDKSLVSLRFECKTLPAEVEDAIRVRLGFANSEDEIKSAFGFDDLPAMSGGDDGLKVLARSLEKLADSYKASK